MESGVRMTFWAGRFAEAGKCSGQALMANAARLARDAEDAPTLPEPAAAVVGARRAQMEDAAGAGGGTAEGAGV